MYFPISLHLTQLRVNMEKMVQMHRLYKEHACTYHIMTHSQSLQSSYSNWHIGKIMITNLKINARNREICIFAMIAVWSELHGTLETSFLTENHMVEPTATGTS